MMFLEREENKGFMGLFEKRVAVSGKNVFGKPKLPPGQEGTGKFPVLTYGSPQKISIVEWRLRAWGLVEEKIWTWHELLKLPQTNLKADFHCVTHWSRFDDEWGGVMFKDLYATLAVRPGAKYVMQHAYGGYTTNLPLQWMLDEEVMLAHTFNGEPLTAEHGGPLRVFTPRRYAWKGAKWLNGFEFLSEDKPGFWERNGYSNTADPWREERFW
jgi:DMSO/TMAO reductase YedYZ molybdopterin-dependent catalytic subunit